MRVRVRVRVRVRARATMRERKGKGNARSHGKDGAKHKDEDMHKGAGTRVRRLVLKQGCRHKGQKACT